MKINFKFNKKKIKKLIWRVLPSVVIISVISVVIYKIYLNDLEHFDELLLTNLTLNETVEGESPLKGNPNRDYGESIRQIAAENEKFILWTDRSTGNIWVEEKKSGKVWSGNPDSGMDDSNINVNVQGRLFSQMIIYCLDSTGKIVTCDSFTHSLFEGGMESELTDQGVKYTFSFPQVGVIIPIQYTLNDEGLYAEILCSEIEEKWAEEYVLISIDVLPYFGAGSLEDEGYVFVPDGSGALMDYNNGRQNNAKYNSVVYGDDLTFKVNLTPKSEQVVLPVFGAKCNENAFLAVVTSGESQSSISALPSKKEDSYNRIYSSLQYRQYSVVRESKHDELNLAYSDVLLQDNYRVEYMFLEKEQADYSGMSQKYREYLLQENLLKQSELAKENHMILDIYGAVVLEKNILGVVTEVVTPMTTYKDVMDIVKELKENGIENIIINYIGSMNGGFEQKTQDTITHENCLGSKKEFEEMYTFLQQEGVTLFLETDPIALYKNGNGYNGRRDGVKSFHDKYAFQYDYMLNNKEPIEEERWYLMTPKKVEQVVSGLAESAASGIVKNISFEGLGSALYSDMNEKTNYTTRSESLKYFVSALKTADEKTDYLLVKTGNAYTLPYIDVVTDIPNCNNGYDILNSSIPFYQMVLRGSVVTGSFAINMTVDYEHAILNSIENGSSLKFSIMKNNIDMLIDTKHNDMNAFSYDRWKKVIINAGLQMQDAYKAVKGEKIVSHRQQDEDVYITTYESGTEIIVNYGSSAFIYEGDSIPEKSYSVKIGGNE